MQCDVPRRCVALVTCVLVVISYGYVDEHSEGKAMSIEMVIELPDRRTAQTVQHVLASHQMRLRSSIQRTRRRLASFEERYGTSTGRFLAAMTAEDLHGGDLEYVEWAGEAKLLEGLEQELRELENARIQLQ